MFSDFGHFIELTRSLVSKSRFHFKSYSLARENFVILPSRVDIARQDDETVQSIWGNSNGALPETPTTT